MNILLLGAFGNGALENYFVQGLREKGIGITCFDIAKDFYGALERSIINKAINKIRPKIFYTPINNNVLQFVKGKTYDAIIVFKGYVLFPQTVALLKKHTKALCCYNPDHPFLFFSEGSGNANILNSITLYDIYISYATNITKELNTRYKVNAFTVPFGYDDSAVAGVNIVNSDITDKWLFIGSYDRQRAAFLNDLNEQQLYIYGDAKWASRNRMNRAILASYQGRSLFGDEYKIAIRNGLGVFNLLRKQNIEEASHNMRTFEVPGYGGLLVANRTEEQQVFFEDNKEAVYFDTIDELKDKMAYLSKHPEEVKKIKQAARLRSQRSNYSYRHRSTQLYQIVLKYLK